MEFLADGSVSLTGPHKCDPAFQGVRGHRRFAVGLDLGQARDPAAVSIIRDEQLPTPVYEGGRQVLGPRSLTVVFLERYRNQDYVALARHAALLMHRAPLSPENARLVIDATGPGRPFKDVLNEIGVAHVPVQMTSGQGWNRGDDGFINASKTFLFYNLAGYLETRKLKVASELPEAKQLLHELSEFQADISAAGNLLVNVRAADHHGDLSVATAISLFALTSLRPGFCGEGKLDGWI